MAFREYSNCAKSSKSRNAGLSRSFVIVEVIVMNIVHSPALSKSIFANGEQ